MTITVRAELRVDPDPRLAEKVSDGDTVRVDLDDTAADGTGALTVTRA